MTKEECKILLPFFQKAYKSVKSKYEKYNDIHNGGEATEREENLLMKYSEQLERLDMESIIMCYWIHQDL